MIRVTAEMLSSPGSFEGLVPAEGRVRTEEVALLLERTTFYGLLSVLVIAAIPYGTVKPWWIALINCLVFFLVSLRIGEGMLRDDWRIAGPGMIIPLLALCIYAGFQVWPLSPLRLNTIQADSAWQTISADPHETKRFIFRFLALVLAGESLLHYTSTRRRLAAIVSVVVGIGVLSAGFGIVRQIAQRDSAGFLSTYLAVGQGYGQFINRNHFAVLMEMCLGLLIGLLVAKSQRRSRFLPYLSLALLIWIALVFTNSRGGVISMLGLILGAATTHLIILKGRSDKRAGKREGSRSRNRVFKYGTAVVMSVALAIPLIVLTVVGVAWVGGDPVASRVETLSGELNEGEVHRPRRKEIWQATWQLIKAHPLTGAGFAGYGAAITRFDTGFAGKGSLRQAHNDYLEILASGGMIGAVLAAWFVIAVIRSVLPQLRARDSFRYSTCLGAVAGMFAVSIHSFFDFGLHITVNALVFTCLVVIATANCSSQPLRVLVQGPKL